MVGSGRIGHCGRPCCSVGKPMTMSVPFGRDSDDECWGVNYFPSYVFCDGRIGCCGRPIRLV